MSEHLLGASIEALTATGRHLAEHIDVPSGADLAVTARRTPMVRRLDAVVAATTAAPRRADWMALLALGAAPSEHLRAGLLTEVAFAASVLGAGTDARILDLDEATRELCAGAEAWLVRDHPLAAWGETLPSMLHGGAATASLPGADVVPTLVFQYVVKAGDTVALDPLVDALLSEASERAAAEGSPLPTETVIRELLASLLGLLVEWGLIEWMPQRRSLGVGCVTGLGAFGWLLTVTSIEGPSAQVEAMIRDAGYLPADDGYIHRDDLPVVLSDN